ncbi:MAG: polysaccharide biosynthesis/export family protein [Verrucomicrobiales bacterium]|nr:polysaccharide biosynthesis/export family protein [Verrucomicrobiales bacterium]
MKTYCSALVIAFCLMSNFAADGAGEKLSNGDSVRIDVFNEGSLSGLFEVTSDGVIMYPLLGRIEAAGRTASEVAADVEARLELDYIRDAQVVVALDEEAEATEGRVVVIGEVNSPGHVVFNSDKVLSLFDAIAASGGVRDRGNKYGIELKRKNGISVTTQRLSLDVDGSMSLRDGDTLTVPALIRASAVVATVNVMGQVKAPGPVQISPDGQFDVISAIAAAGGFTPMARPGKVIVRRTTNEGIKTFELNVARMQRQQTKPFLLEANDTVTVAESIF